MLVELAPGDRIDVEMPIFNGRNKVDNHRKLIDAMAQAWEHLPARNLAAQLIPSAT